MSDHLAWLVASAAFCAAVAFMPRDRSWPYRFAELLAAYIFLIVALEQT
jgi:hypothetical protein